MARVLILCLGILSADSDSTSERDVGLWVMSLGGQVLLHGQGSVYYTPMGFPEVVSIKGVLLEETKVTDTALARLSQLAAIERLELVGTRITDAGLTHLTTMKELRVLCLKGASVTDLGLESLKGLINLRELDLSRTRVKG